MNKKLLTFAVVGLFALTFVAAVSYYAIATVTFNVNQPISVKGDGPQTVPCDAGQTCIGDMITVENSADYEKLIVITDNSIPKIEVNYVGRLELDNKDLNWDRITGDGIKGELYYFITGDELGYHFEAEGLNDVEYALLYYADDTDRFNVWGGSPAVLIDSGVASSGELTLEGSTPIGDLPFDTDWNVDGTPNYCNYNNLLDDYDHCYGAKIWLVPMSDYDVGTEKVVNWNPTEWLFETDLIYYFENSNGEYTIGGESFVEFYPLFTVDPYLSTGTHTIDITVA